MQKTRVLIVEDERDIAGLIKHTLERGGDTLHVKDVKLLYYYQNRTAHIPVESAS